MVSAKNGQHSTGTARPVITGVGLVHPASLSGNDLWSAIVEGRPNFATVTRFDAGSYECSIAGEIDEAILDHAIDPRKRRTTTHVAQLALVAAERAIRAANLGNADDDIRRNFGIFIGTTLGGWAQAEQQHSILIEKGARRVNPFLAAGSPHYTVGIELASSLGAQGTNMTFSSGCPASIQAISHAAELVRTRQISMCLCGGAESPITPVTFASLCRSNELTTHNSMPNQASRPFDRDHNGMVLTEGACFFIVESEESAKDRRVPILAEIAGAASSCDAKGMYQLDTSGDSGADALHRMARQIRLDPTEIDYVCAHANSAPAFDRKEAAVLKKAFGEFAAKIPVSSIKGVLGHPFGASGAFQTAAAAMAMKTSLIPATYNLVNPDPECDLDLVMGEARSKTIRHALVTSYGYGGLNAYLLLRNPNL